MSEPPRTLPAPPPSRFADQIAALYEHTDLEAVNFLTRIYFEALEASPLKPYREELVMNYHAHLLSRIAAGDADAVVHEAKLVRNDEALHAAFQQSIKKIYPDRAVTSQAQPEPPESPPHAPDGEADPSS